MGNRLLLMKAKTELLSLLTEAFRTGQFDIALDVMPMLKQANASTAEVSTAMALGRTKQRLGL